MLKRKFIVSIMLFLLLSSTAIALSSSYIGASTTGKFHYLDCRWAEKIRADHRVHFSTREEAINAGYVPCKVCRP